jgi:hypothetical protein
VRAEIIRLAKIPRNHRYVDILLESVVECILHSPDVPIHQTARAKTGLVTRGQHRSHVTQSGVDAVADKLIKFGQTDYWPKIADLLSIALLVQY